MSISAQKGKSDMADMTNPTKRPRRTIVRISLNPNPNFCMLSAATGST